MWHMQGSKNVLCNLMFSYLFSDLLLPGRGFPSIILILRSLEALRCDSGPSRACLALSLPLFWGPGWPNAV